MYVGFLGGLPGGSVVKNILAIEGDMGRSLEDPLEKEIETHASVLAGKIPWTEEPGML